MRFELDSVSVSFDGIPALTGITASIEPGSFVVVTGPTGSGKTTLLRLLYADVLPTKGTVRIDGTSTERLSARALRALRRQMGIALQDARLVDEVEVITNLELVLRLRGVAAKDASRRATATLLRLGIGYLRERLPQECSAGERQLVALACALVSEPTCIIADEPTGNLDVDATGVVAEALRAEHRRGATVIVATHDPVLAAHFPDAQRLALYDGRLVPHDVAIS